MTHLFPKPRLTPEEVLKIYAVRPARRKDNTFIPCTKFSRELAAQFNINERTVRDIWNRRTRRDITRPVWTAEDLAADLADPAATDSATIVHFASSSPSFTSFLPSFVVSSTGTNTTFHPSPSSQPDTSHMPSPPPSPHSFSTLPLLLPSQQSYDFLAISEDQDQADFQFFPEEDEALWRDEPIAVPFRAEQESSVGKDPFSRDWTRAVERVRSMGRGHGEEEDFGERTRKCASTCSYMFDQEGEESQHSLPLLI